MVSFDFILGSTTGISVYDFFFNDLWRNSHFWRYTTIFAIFLIIFYKRKYETLEKTIQNVEHDKNLIRKALLSFSEINLRELINDLLNNNQYSEVHLLKLKELQNFLEESEKDILKQNLKKAVNNLKPIISNMTDFMEKEFDKSPVRGFRRFKTEEETVEAESFEYNDKIFIISNEFELKFLNFMHEIKKEFI